MHACYPELPISSPLPSHYFFYFCTFPSYLSSPPAISEQEKQPTRMYAVGPRRQKACEERGRYFSSDSNFALPKKLRQCAVCSHFGLSTTRDFCNVCTQYGVIRASDYGPKVIRHWPDSTDVPLFCKECSQYVLSSSPRFCLACSQHDGSSPPDDHSPEPSRHHQRTKDCFRNENDFNKFLESCSNTRGHDDAALADDFSPKGHALGGDDIYEVTVNRGRVRERSSQGMRTYRGGSKSRGKTTGNHESCEKGYGGIQESVAKMVACYGAKATRRSRDTTQCARSPARSPRTTRLGTAKTPNSAPPMRHICADHGLTVPVAPCLNPCTDHGLPLR